MAEIQTVFFDWGGVLIEDPTPGLMRYCATSLNVSPIDMTRSHHQHGTDFCTGKITESCYWERMCQDLNCPAPSHSLWGEAFRSVYSPRPFMLNLAKSLQQQGIQTALLSNTEQPSVDFYRHDLKYTQFNHAIFSCEHGCCKPAPELYRIALNKTETLPHRSIFIDDRKEFVSSAENFGIQATRFTGFKALKDYLRNFSIDIEPRHKPVSKCG